MGRCLKNEAALERVRSKVEQMDNELNQPRSWKTTMEKKFELSKRERKELEQSMGVVKTALEGKEKEIKNQRIGSVRLKRSWCVSSTTSTLCCQSLETHSFRGSMTPSVRSRRPIPTWTFQTLKWRIKLRRPSCLLLQMTRTTSLLRLMVKVKGS